MIEIAISNELAAEHPQFMADCADRGHHVHVFDAGVDRREPAVSSSARDGDGENRLDRSEPAGRR